MRRRLAHSLLAGLTVSGLACSRERTEAEPSLTVFNAAALGPPFRDLLAAFASTTGPLRTQQENAPSLEVIRKLTELGQVPDILAVADQALLLTLVLPRYASWYLLFGTNALVLAYGPGAKHAAEINADNWWQVLQRPSVQVGRSDMRVDPSGYRADMVMQLAETYYGQPELTRRLRATIPERNVRRAEADLSAHLEIGELDYGWTYESLAIAHGLKYVKLPPQIDLSDPAYAQAYSRAEVTIPEPGGRPPLLLRGAPIIFALTIPTEAQHPRIAEQFVRFLLSPGGAAVLRRSGFTVLAQPRFHGTPPAGLTTSGGHIPASERNHVLAATGASSAHPLQN
jgi:molybdate/tungstate transport system substrate-binding protein